MKLEINKTVATIMLELESTAVPIDIFRIINCVGHRSWKFELVFDEKNNNIINIIPDPYLSEKELYELFSGKLPALYFSDLIIVDFNDAVYQLKGLSYLDKRSTCLEFKPTDGSREQGKISLRNYPPIPPLNNPEKMNNWFCDNTSFGAEGSSSSGLNVEMIVYANTYNIARLASTRTNLPEAKFKKVVKSNDIVIDNITISSRYKSESREKNIIRHNVYGKFEIKEYKKDFWNKISLCKDCVSEVYTESRDIEWFTERGPGNYKEVRKVAETILEFKEEIVGSDEYKNFIGEVESYKRRVTLVKLEKRRARVLKSNIICVGDKILMKEPTCENELMALYMKIEALGLMPFECRVYEYTSKIGIDALGDYKIKENETLKKIEPIEFEHMFENYFDHDHPIDQTGMIICWNVKGTYEYETENKFDIINAWLMIMHTKTRKIPIIRLCNIPGIEMKHFHKI